MPSFLAAWQIIAEGLLLSGENCLDDDILSMNVLPCRRIKIDDHETASSLKANGKIFFPFSSYFFTANISMFII